MTNEYLKAFAHGELSHACMLIELGVRDLAEVHARKKHEESVNNLLVSRDVEYRFVDCNETFFIVQIWKHDIIKDVLDNIDEIKNPILL